MRREILVFLSWALLSGCQWDGGGQGAPGAGWQAQAVPASAAATNFSSISVVDANTAWVVGDQGTILKTTDGGATWLSQANPLSGSATQFTSVSALDGNVAWVLGSPQTVLRTTDGGSTWTVQQALSADPQLPPTSLNVLSALAADSAVTAGTLTYPGPGISGPLALAALFTADGGSTWSTSRIPLQGETGECCQFVSAARAGSQTLWLAGGYGCPFHQFCTALFTTADGGVTWADRSGSADTLGFINSISAVDASTLFAVSGASGPTVANLLSRSTDGGSTWTSHPAPTGVTPVAIAAASAQDAWAVGYGGAILATLDGGNHWTLQPSGTQSTLSAVAVAPSNPSTLWAVGASGVILKATQGGQ